LCEADAIFNQAANAGSTMCNALSLAYGRPANTMDGTATATTLTTDEVRSRMKIISVDRVRDGVYEAHWFPSGAPQYYSPLVDGLQANSNFLDSGPVVIIMINGDTTATGSATGNPYSLEIIWHWEIIPASRIALAIQPTASPYDVAALSSTLNALQFLPFEYGPDGRSLPSGQVTKEESAWERSGSQLGSVGATAASFGLPLAMTAMGYMRRGR